MHTLLRFVLNELQDDEEYRLIKSLPNSIVQHAATQHTIENPASLLWPQHGSLLPVHTVWSGHQPNVVVKYPFLTKIDIPFCVDLTSSHTPGIICCSTLLYSIDCTSSFVILDQL